MASSISGVSVKPAAEPRDRFTLSTFRRTQSSRAARMVAQPAPPPDWNTCITTSWASGATPMTLLPSTLLAAAIPATWVPWSDPA